MHSPFKVIRYPGKLVNYNSALELQRSLVAQKLSPVNRQSEPDYLILLEHEPAITLGRRCHDELKETSTDPSSIPIIKSNRGGRITYHGPGQLTCYPIIDLKRQSKLSLECYVRNLALVMKETLTRAYGIENSFYDDRSERVGLWLPGNKKIGFIGIQAQKWVTSHGFSLNLQRKCLQGFQEIDPCGLRNQNVQIVCADDEKSNKDDKDEIEKVQDILIESFKAKFY